MQHDGQRDSIITTIKLLNLDHYLRTVDFDFWKYLIDTFKETLELVSPDQSDAFRFACWSWKAESRQTATYLKLNYIAWNWKNTWEKFIRECRLLGWFTDKSLVSPILWKHDRNSKASCSMLLIIVATCFDPSDKKHLKNTSWSVKT